MAMTVPNGYSGVTNKEGNEHAHSRLPRKDTREFALLQNSRTHESQKLATTASDTGKLHSSITKLRISYTL